MILVTGGAGFIGSNFVLEWLAGGGEPLLNLDKLTYAGNLANLAAVRDHPAHHFVHGDIADQVLVAALLANHRPRAVLNFAAESHVDRSISGPDAFVRTNVLGTCQLLETVRAYWQTLPGEARADFRFLQVSTDEVYGSLSQGAAPFTEMHCYAPNSPYAASKAAADHFVRAYGQTYGLPVLTANCSNNYGPRQFPEKLIPLCILNALAGRPLPLYGDGQQIRDWLYVADHCAALRVILANGQPGRTYNVGGGQECRNLDLVQTLCALLDELKPRGDGHAYASQITFVADRPGHDRRYAIDVSRLAHELGWRPRETLRSGLQQTVAWYLAHPEWVSGLDRGALVPGEVEAP